MAIIEKDGLRGEWNEELNCWVNPPQMIEPLPQRLELDLITHLAEDLAPYKQAIDAWLLTSPIMQALFASKRTYDLRGIDTLIQVIQNESLAPDIQGIIISKLEEIKGKLQ